VGEQDRNRHASLHNFSTEFHGHQNRKIGASTVTEAKPVSFYRELEPNKYLNAPDIEGARCAPRAMCFATGRMHNYPDSNCKAARHVMMQPKSYSASSLSSYEAAAF